MAVAASYQLPLTLTLNISTKVGRDGRTKKYALIALNFFVLLSQIGIKTIKIVEASRDGRTKKYAYMDK